MIGEPRNKYLEHLVKQKSLLLRGVDIGTGALIWVVTGWLILAPEMCLPLQGQLAPRPRQRVEVSTENVVSDGVDQRSAEFILKYQGIETSVESFRAYLQSLQPDHPSQLANAGRARNLIRKLGSESYGERRAARERLTMMPTIPLSDLRVARTSNDPEVRASAAMILQYSTRRAPKDSLDGITRAVGKTIIEKKMVGLARELLAAVNLFDHKATLRTLQKAVAVSAIEEDEEVLLELISAEKRELRLAALGGFVSIKKQDSFKVLIDLIEDNDDHVRFYACRELANMGNRNSINGLLALMESSDLGIRQKSHRTLRSLTGQCFKYFAFEKPEVRESALTRWRDWVQSHGGSSELFFPLVETRVVVGRILVSDYSADRVIEFDMLGNVTWEQELSKPWAVEGLPNGNRLIGLYEDSALVEFDTDGNEIWRVDNVPGKAMGIDREDDRTLVACSSAEKVVEYNMEGEIIWETKVAGHPTDVEYLENGNIMVILMSPHQVIEITRDGKRVWELQAEVNTSQGQRTDRGTTIIVNANQKTIVEYDHDGNKVGQVKSTNNVTAAREMENGDYIISSANAIRMQKRDGTVLWEYDKLTYCYNISPF